MDANATCVLGTFLPYDEPVHYMNASYRGKLFYSCGISKIDGVWIKNRTIRTMFEPFFVDGKMKLAGVTLYGHQIDADEILHD